MNEDTTPEAFRGTGFDEEVDCRAMGKNLWVIGFGGIGMRIRMLRLGRWGFLRVGRRNEECFHVP